MQRRSFIAQLGRLFGLPAAAAGAPAAHAQAASAAPAETAAEALAEQLLAAVGGRSAWAAVTHLVNDSQQNRLDEPTVVRATVTIDFTRPRLRIDTLAPGLVLARALDGERHWRLARSGAIEPVPALTLAEDRRWYAGHVYRTLHRLAARDPALTVAVTPTRRLEVLEAGRRIAWYALDARGEPYAFGAHDDEVCAISGPWAVVQSGIHHPAWVARPDGSWRAWLQRLEVNPPLRDGLFDPPGPITAPR